MDTMPNAAKASPTMFNRGCTYEIGVMRPGNGNAGSVPNAELKRTGPDKLKKLLGSQLIENDITSLDQLFRENPFGLTEGKSYDVFEVNPDTRVRRHIGSGTVLPKPKPAQEAAPGMLADGTAQDPRSVIPLFEQEEREAERRYDSLNRMHRQTIEALQDELHERTGTVDQAFGLIEEALARSDRAMDKISEALELIRQTAAQRDQVQTQRNQTAEELAAVKAKVESILQRREFEEQVRREREEERQAWLERERELERAAEEQRGLGDVLEQIAPFMPLLQMILERLLPPQAGGTMPGGPMGMPPGMMQQSAMQRGTMRVQQPFGMPSDNPEMRGVRDAPPQSRPPMNGAASANANPNPDGAAAKVF
ncbi:MAG TPA: hypothetical protein VHI13_11745 [Candidatus Kapabacteria bacterium]|nr:hypothetical protein [Candidatus Kapabacteria bacterium]